MNVPDTAIDLIRRFEGLRLDAYRCPAGVWTIGYGHTAALGEPIPRLGMVITEDAAETILRADVADVAERIRPLITVELTDNQFGALVSFAFNLGVRAFDGSTLRQVLNQGQYAAVPNELLRWVKGGRPIRVLPGLVARREAEGKLWRS